MGSGQDKEDVPGVPGTESRENDQPSSAKSQPWYGCTSENESLSFQLLNLGRIVTPGAC